MKSTDQYDTPIIDVCGLSSTGESDNYMNDDIDADTSELTLAFSLSTIEKLEDPKAVFEDAQNWSRSIGLIDSDTEQIEQIVAEHDLRQDFDIQDRDKWFFSKRSARQQLHHGMSVSGQATRTCECRRLLGVCSCHESS